LFHADGRTNGWVDMRKLVVAFRNLVNAPKNLSAVHNIYFVYFCCISFSIN